MPDAMTSLDLEGLQPIPFDLETTRVRNARWAIQS